MKAQKTLLCQAAARAWRGIAMILAVGAIVGPNAAVAEVAPSAAARMNQLGPENQALVRRLGLWNMTETVWAAPGAAPVTTTGLVAERRMIGSMLEEMLRPPAANSTAAVRRIDYLSFNRVEGRWEYVSMDLRAAVGIMTAQSYTRGENGRIDLMFQPFTVPGAGSRVTGQMLRMQQIITYQGPDRDMKEQYFIMADGSGTRWLAHRYSYVRRP